MRFKCASVIGFLAVRAACAAAHHPKPNIVFIMTDDQDLHLNSLDYMPLLKRHLLDEGTFYTRHFCTVSLCCPSRVSLLTGRAAHNTNVTDVSPPYGGYPKFIQEGLNEAYLPIWLQNAGYNTYYLGKLMNSQNTTNYNNPYVAGWTSSDFLLDPWTYSYLNSTWQKDKEQPVSAKGLYSTDVIANKTYNYLDEAFKAGKPFFLTTAPIAPHSDAMPDAAGRLVMSDPVPAERHRYLFQNVTIPRTPNFNPDKPSGVSWVAQLPKQSQSNIDYNDEYYRKRLRTLQAVDEMIDGIISRLDQLGILDNTYIVYTSDNGYHIGQHRLQAGKRCGFEEDVNVPLIIRGPGVPRGEVTNILSSHTDLAPTFFRMLGIELRDEFDGSPIPFTRPEIKKAAVHRYESVNIEHWGAINNEGTYKFSSTTVNNTYKTLRLYSSSFNLYYSVYCNNDHELYDLATDPYQINNLLRSEDGSFTLSIPSLLNSSITIRGFKLNQIVSRLDALMMVMKRCKAKECIEPWSVLHPQGNVKCLTDALNPRFDDFYATALAENRVSYSRCELGQLLSAEGPQDPMVYEDSMNLELLS